MSVEILSNHAARRLFLHRHGLSDTPTGPAKGAGLAALVGDLGFVQVDSIATVERAHHMILFARRRGYRAPHLAPLVERHRSLWEHWTHDAAILPIGHYPHWRHRFERDAQRLHDRWRNWFREGYEAQFDTILNRIARDGPVTSAEVGEGEARGRGGWWDWHPSKTALEWLWRTGALAITRRDSFRKVYDLSERVIPEAQLAARTDAAETVDWACWQALDRLGFATSGELAAFWHLVTPEQAKVWVAARLQDGALVEIAVEGADGNRRRHVARPGTVAESTTLPEPPARLRILSPFDPALRDRARAERLFGFHYRIEVFVPEAKRRYGYYVFPILEGTRLVGRIDMKAHRGEGVLRVRALWPEAGVSFGKLRLSRLEAELERMADFAGCERVEFSEGWLRDALPSQR
ncbi:MAG: winged helix-turn-helix domain-containing protein [Paracoccaceae bacterium]